MQISHRSQKSVGCACCGQALEFAQTNEPKERRDRGRHEILIIFSLSSLDEKAVRSHKALPGTFAWNSKVNKTCETNFWMKPAHTVTPRSRKAIIDTVAGANTSRFVKNKLFNNCKCFWKLFAAQDPRRRVHVVIYRNVSFGDSEKLRNYYSRLRGRKIGKDAFMVFLETLSFSLEQFSAITMTKPQKHGASNVGELFCEAKIDKVLMFLFSRAFLDC